MEGNTHSTMISMQIVAINGCEIGQWNIKKSMITISHQVFLHFDELHN